MHKDHEGNKLRSTVVSIATRGHSQILFHERRRSSDEIRKLFSASVLSSECCANTSTSTAVYSNIPASSTTMSPSEQDIRMMMHYAITRPKVSGCDYTSRPGHSPEKPCTTLAGGNPRPDKAFVPETMKFH